jgi:hypothetical protein
LGVITVRPLFWYPGGKRRVASLVWRGLGPVNTYVEPFAGSLSVLLARPAADLTAPGRQIEVVNDWSGRIMNLYRAIKANPRAVWASANCVRSTVELDARHRRLNAQTSRLDALLRDDPEFFDATLAGWQLYTLRYATHPRAALDETRTSIGRPAINPPTLTFDEVIAVQHRLETVRTLLLCGDWAKAVTRALCEQRMPTGVFLDPPYLSANRADDLYVTEGRDAALACRQWAIQHGDDPRYRIVLCGYADEGCPPGWAEIAWSSGAGGESRHQERLWFSPQCDPSALTSAA